MEDHTSATHQGPATVSHRSHEAAETLFPESKPESTHLEDLARVPPKRPTLQTLKQSTEKIISSQTRTVFKPSHPSTNKGSLRQKIQLTGMHTTKNLVARKMPLDGAHLLPPGQQKSSEDSLSMSSHPSNQALTMVRNTTTFDANMSLQSSQAAHKNIVTVTLSDNQRQRKSSQKQKPSRSDERNKDVFIASVKINSQNQEYLAPVGFGSENAGQDVKARAKTSQEARLPGGKYLFKNKRNYQILDQNGRKYVFAANTKERKSKWRSITPTAFISDFYERRRDILHGEQKQPSMVAPIIPSQSSQIASRRSSQSPPREDGYISQLESTLLDQYSSYLKTQGVSKIKNFIGFQNYLNANYKDILLKKPKAELASQGHNFENLFQTVQEYYHRESELSTARNQTPNLSSFEQGESQRTKREPKPEGRRTVQIKLDEKANPNKAKKIYAILAETPLGEEEVLSITNQRTPGGGIVANDNPHTLKLMLGKHGPGETARMSEKNHSAFDSFEKATAAHRRGSDASSKSLHLSKPTQPTHPNMSSGEGKPLSAFASGKDPVVDYEPSKQYPPITENMVIDENNSQSQGSGHPNLTPGLSSQPHSVPESSEDDGYRPHQIRPQDRLQLDLIKQYSNGLQSSNNDDSGLPLNSNYNAECSQMSFSPSRTTKATGLNYIKHNSLPADPSQLSRLHDKMKARDDQLRQMLNSEQGHSRPQSSGRVHEKTLRDSGNKSSFQDYECHVVVTNKQREKFKVHALDLNKQIIRKLKEEREANHVQGGTFDINTQRTSQQAKVYASQGSSTAQGTATSPQPQKPMAVLQLKKLQNQQLRLKQVRTFGSAGRRSSEANSPTFRGEDDDIVVNASRVTMSTRKRRNQSVASTRRPPPRKEQKPSEKLAPDTTQLIQIIEAGKAIEVAPQKRQSAQIMTDLSTLAVKTKGRQLASTHQIPDQSYSKMAKADGSAGILTMTLNSSTKRSVLMRKNASSSKAEYGVSSKNYDGRKQIPKMNADIVNNLGSFYPNEDIQYIANSPTKKKRRPSEKRPAVEHPEVKEAKKLANQRPPSMICSWQRSEGNSKGASDIKQDSAVPNEEPTSRRNFFSDGRRDSIDVLRGSVPSKVKTLHEGIIKKQSASGTPDEEYQSSVERVLQPTSVQHQRKLTSGKLLHPTMSVIVNNQIDSTEVYSPLLPRQQQASTMRQSSDKPPSKAKEGTESERKHAQNVIGKKIQILQTLETLNNQKQIFIEHQGLLEQFSRNQSFNGTKTGQKGSQTGGPKSPKFKGSSNSSKFKFDQLPDSFLEQYKPYSLTHYYNMQQAAKMRPLNAPSGPTSRRGLKTTSEWARAMALNPIEQKWPGSMYDSGMSSFDKSQKKTPPASQKRKSREKQVSPTFSAVRGAQPPKNFLPQTQIEAKQLVNSKLPEDATVTVTSTSFPWKQKTLKPASVKPIVPPLLGLHQKLGDPEKKGEVSFNKDIKEKSSKERQLTYVHLQQIQYKEHETSKEKKATNRLPHHASSQFTESDGPMSQTLTTNQERSFRLSKQPPQEEFSIPAADEKKQENDAPPGEEVQRILTHPAPQGRANTSQGFYTTPPLFADTEGSKDLPTKKINSKLTQPTLPVEDSLLGSEFGQEVRREPSIANYDLYLQAPNNPIVSKRLMNNIGKSKKLLLSQIQIHQKQNFKSMGRNMRILHQRGLVPDPSRQEGRSRSKFQNNPVFSTLMEETFRPKDLEEIVPPSSNKEQLRVINSTIATQEHRVTSKSTERKVSISRRTGRARSELRPRRGGPSQHTIQMQVENSREEVVRQLQELEWMDQRMRVFSKLPALMELI